MKSSVRFDQQPTLGKVPGSLAREPGTFVVFIVVLMMNAIAFGAASKDICSQLFVAEKNPSTKDVQSEKILSGKSELRTPPVTLTSQDVLNVSDVSRAYRASHELREKMSRLSIAEARETSFPYFESQVKQALLILDTVSTEPSALRDEALHLISSQQLTMEKVTSVLLRIEALRSKDTFLKDLGKKTSIGKISQDDVDNNSRSIDTELKWALTGLTEMAQDGIFPFPTYAPLKIRSFRGIYPQVNPIGFVREPRVSFDGRRNVLAIKLSVHDITDHRFVHHVTPGFFEKFRALENNFLKKFAAQNPPALLAYAEFRFFDAKHEQTWAQAVNVRMGQGAFDEDAIENLQYGFEVTILQENEDREDLMGDLSRMAPEAYNGLMQTYGSARSAKAALRKLDQQMIELIGEGLRETFLTPEGIHLEAAARHEALELKKRLNEMTVDARRAFSVPYFAAQMRQSMKMFRELKSSGFDPRRVLPTSHVKYDQLFFERLVDIFNHAEERFLKMEKTQTFTMENVTREMLSIEMLRSVATLLEKVHHLDNDSKMATLRYEISLDDFARSLLQISQDAEQGHILFPTYAPLSVKSFSGLWPQLRPIGFSTERMVSFDGLEPMPSVTLPIHDLIGHRPFRFALETTLHKFVRLELEYLKRVRAFNPVLEDFAQARFFQASHEVDLGVENTRGWTVDMQKHFETPNSTQSPATLAVSFREQFQNRFADWFFRGDNPTAFQELYPQGYASLKAAIGAPPFDIEAVHRIDAELERLMRESIQATAHEKN